MAQADILERIYFGLCAVLAVAGAIGTVSFPNPIRGALSLLFTAAPATTAPLKWLAGSWRAVDAKHNASSEEVWVYSDAGLVGLYRETMDGKAGFYELSSIVAEGDKVVLSSRMFDRALEDSKKTAGAPLRFVLESAGFQKATFKGEGANKATLAANLQPFVAAVLAVVLLSEPLSWLQVAGGVLIAVGILAVRRRASPRPVVLESDA